MSTTEQQVRRGAARLGTGLIGRGVVAILVAIVLLAWPAISLQALVLVLGSYATVDGAIALGTAFTPAAKGRRWWPILQGIAGIVFGLLVLLWPGLTALALLYVIGSWAIVLGAVAIGGAFTADRSGGDRVLLGLHGALGVLLGIVLWWRPGAGALALVALLAGVALTFGVTQIAMGLLLRSAR